MSISRDIEHQIQDLVDGRLDEEQQKALIAKIAEDPVLIRLYVSHVRLDTAIKESTRFSPVRLAELRRTASRRPRPWKAILASAAVVALSLIALYQVMAATPPPLANFRAAQGTVYQLERSEGNAPASGSMGLFEGDEMTITQGAVELSFESGVSGIIQAPANVVFENKNQITMTEGRGYFDVPTEMTGFKVITRDLVAIDLGTVFAVKADEGSPDEVHVIKGKVEVAPQNHAERGKVVETEQALASLGSDLTTKIPFKGQNFLKRLPDQLPHLHIPGEVTDDGTLLVNGSTLGEGQIKARFVPGKLGDEARPTTEGRFGNALKLTGNGEHFLTDWMGIGGDAPRTVAFWVRLNPGEVGYDTACVVWGFRPQGEETVNRKWNVQVALDRDTKSRCILNTTFGGLWLEGSTPLDDGQWHHVAAVYAGRNLPSGMPDLRLFVDGKEESGSWMWNEPIDREQGETQVRTETRAQAGANPLRIGKPLRDQNTFRGELDEIYVIAGALEAEAVRTLWKSNRLKLAHPPHR